MLPHAGTAIRTAAAAALRSTGRCSTLVRGTGLPGPACRGFIPSGRAARNGQSIGRRWLAQTPGSTPGFSGTPVTWGTLGIFTLIGGGAAFYVHLERERRRLASAKRQAEVKGAAAIGGPFELVDSENKPFHSDKLKGSWAILYFGFTFCPDICPEELDKLTECLQILDSTPGIPEVTPVFISIDPNRDTPAKVKEYLKDFHPRMIGLTGTEDQVKAACKQYRVYYSKPSTDDSEDYLVDHSIIMYLVNPDGAFVNYYGQIIPAEQMAAGIIKEVEASKHGTSEEPGFLQVLADIPTKIFS